MANLSTKVKLYCEANGKTAIFQENVFLQNDNDGKGSYIAKWSVDGLAKPSDSQLASYETSGNTKDSNNVIRDKRKAEYGSVGDQLDLLYKDMIAGKGDSTGEWFKAVKKIKDDNPKE